MTRGRARSARLRRAAFAYARVRDGGKSAAREAEATLLQASPIAALHTRLTPAHKHTRTHTRTHTHTHTHTHTQTDTHTHVSPPLKPHRQELISRGFPLLSAADAAHVAFGRGA